MNPWMWIALPLIGALIGWCTNWLAVKMIFRPRTKRRILGITFEGLLPRRRSQLATSVAETVERDLLSVDQIQSLVQRMIQGDEIRSLLREKIETLLKGQISKLGPLAAGFLSGDTFQRLQTKVQDEILVFIEGLGSKIHEGLAENLDIREMVRTRIESFDLARLEDIIQRIAAQELQHIVILGGILGFVVGLAEVGLLWILS